MATVRRRRLRMAMVPRPHRVTHHHSMPMALLLHNKDMEAMDSQRLRPSSMGTTRVLLHSSTATMAHHHRKVRYRHHSHLALA